MRRKPRGEPRRKLEAQSKNKYKNYVSIKNKILDLEKSKTLKTHIKNKIFDIKRLKHQKNTHQKHPKPPEAQLRRTFS